MPDKLARQKPFSKMKMGRAADGLPVRSPPHESEHPMIPAPGPMLHIRYRGQSQNIALDDLGVEPRATTQQIRAAAARWLDVAPDALAAYVVEAEPNGNYTLRPEAVFG